MPKYQTPEDKKRQLEAARRYCAVYGFQLEPAPGGDFSEFDYVFRERSRWGHGEPFEVAELKCRKNPSTTYSTVWVETRKVRALRKWAEFYSAKPVFIVLWADDVMRRFYVTDIEDVAALEMVKRENRGGETQHPAFALPLSEMEVVP